MKSMVPKVSVIIPTKNRASFLKRCLSSIKELDYPNFEVIVINDGSDEKTKKLLDEFKPEGFSLKILENQTQLGAAQSRNKGIKIAQGEIIAFTDDDCLVDKKWLSELVNTFKNKPCLGVIGSVFYEIKGAHFPQRIVQNPKARMPMTSNIAYKKDVLEKIQGFDPFFAKFNYEDKDLALKVLKFGPIISNIKAKIFHQVSWWDMKTFLESAKRPQAWIYLLKKYKDKIYLDKKNPPPILFRFILFPQDYFFLLSFPLLLPFLLIRYLIVAPKKDLKLFFAKWPLWFILRRFYIWKAAFREKIFLV